MSSSSSSSCNAPVKQPPSAVKRSRRSFGYSAIREIDMPSDEEGIQSKGLAKLFKSKTKPATDIGSLAAVDSPRSKRALEIRPKDNTDIRSKDTESSPFDEDSIVDNSVTRPVVITVSQSAEDATAQTAPMSSMSVNDPPSPASYLRGLNYVSGGSVKPAPSSGNDAAFVWDDKVDDEIDDSSTLMSDSLLSARSMSTGFTSATGSYLTGGSSTLLTDDFVQETVSPNRSTETKKSDPGWIGVMGDVGVVFNDLILDGKACVGCVVDSARESACDSPESREDRIR